MHIVPAITWRRAFVKKVPVEVARVAVVEAGTGEGQKRLLTSKVK